jgi:hypothetical protein
MKPLSTIVGPALLNSHESQVVREHILSIEHTCCVYISLGTTVGPALLNCHESQVVSNVFCVVYIIISIYHGVPKRGFVNIKEKNRQEKNSM